MEGLALGDRRKHKRFLVKKESSFFLTEQSKQMGKLLDISDGGFAINYIAEKEWEQQTNDLGMLFGEHGSCIKDLPVRVVSDYVVDNELTGNSLIVRRRCLEFGNLDENQKFLLECFIWINGTAEC